MNVTSKILRHAENLQPGGPWIFSATKDGRVLAELETGKRSEARKFVRLYAGLGFGIRISVLRRPTIEDTVVAAKRSQPKGPWTFGVRDDAGRYVGGCTIHDLDAEDFRAWFNETVERGFSPGLQTRWDGTALPFSELLARSVWK